MQKGSPHVLVKCGKAHYEKRANHERDVCAPEFLATKKTKQEHRCWHTGEQQHCSVMEKKDEQVSICVQKAEQEWR